MADQVINELKNTHIILLFLQENLPTYSPTDIAR